MKSRLFVMMIVAFAVLMTGCVVPEHNMDSEEFGDINVGSSGMPEVPLTIIIKNSGGTDFSSVTVLEANGNAIFDTYYNDELYVSNTGSWYQGMTNRTFIIKAPESVSANLESDGTATISSTEVIVHGIWKNGYVDGIEELALLENSDDMVSGGSSEDLPISASFEMPHNAIDALVPFVIVIEEGGVGNVYVYDIGDDSARPIIWEMTSDRRYAVRIGTEAKYTYVTIHDNGLASVEGDVSPEYLKGSWRSGIHTKPWS